MVWITKIIVIAFICAMFSALTLRVLSILRQRVFGIFRAEDIERTYKCMPVQCMKLAP